MTKRINNFQNNKFTSRLPLIIATVVLISATAFTLAGSYAENNGHFSFTLDDAYIHMAIAKNLVEHGVWGVSSHEFSSTSSSPLWTLLLAGTYLIFGIGENIPWILNLLAAIGLLAVVHRLLCRWNIHEIYSLIVLLLLLIVYPVVPMVRTGMEHLIHGLLTVLFAWKAVEILTDNSRNSKGFLPAAKIEWTLVVIAPLLSMIRYEGLLEIGVVALMFIIRGRFKFAITLLTAALIPTIALGIFSIVMGGYFLPNSLLIKGSLPDFTNFGNTLLSLGLTSFRAITMFPHLGYPFYLALIVFAYGYYNNSRRLWSKSNLFLFLAIASYILHLQFAKSGWFYRYESYLLGWGLTAVAIAIYENFPRDIKHFSDLRTSTYWALIVILSIFAGNYLTFRSAAANVKTIQATTNIYHQQYQMGRFIDRYYSGKAVMLNDIGAPCYLADFRCFDYTGLANSDVLRKIRSKTYTPEMLLEICRERDVRIAIIYRSWLANSPGKPKDWFPIGTWTIPNNTICSNKTVEFYVVDPDEEATLRENFRNFTSSLPKEVSAREIAKRIAVNE